MFVWIVSGVVAAFGLGAVVSLTAAIRVAMLDDEHAGRPRPDPRATYGPPATEPGAGPAGATVQRDRHARVT